MYDIKVIKQQLHHLNRSPELIRQLDKIIDGLDETAPKIFRVELDLFKLDVLAKIGEVETAATLAQSIFTEHPRESFPSDIEYGDTMYQIVESLAKTGNLGIAYEIIQKMRMSLYNKPINYLSYILDKSLIEVHIETSDYKRALELTLSVLDNQNYMEIDEIQNWRPIAINEIAYLYTQLGEGENALIYLKEAAGTLETRALPLAKLKKARALNYANRGRAYLLIQDYDQARRMGLKVKDANEDLNQSYLSAVSHRLIGLSNYHTGRYESAAIHLKASIDLAEIENSLSLKRSLYYDYAMTLEKLGQSETAVHWYKALYALETERQETISATRAKLNTIELTAFKDYQTMIHLHHELERNQAINKMMLFTIFSLLMGGCILIWLLGHLNKNQKKLIQSEAEAQVANQAKSEFLANMSHEIRTPMNGVLGMAQVLEKTSLTTQQKVYLDIINHSGTTLLDLISDILDFSKIEADKMAFNYQPCNLDETIKSVISLLSPNAAEKGLVLSYDYPVGFPKHFILDNKRVRQIVMNLVENAIKFTAEGFVHVDVQGTVENGHARLDLSVSDTGIGIKTDQLALVFDKFTQVGTQPNGSPGGAGLGLAISYKLSQAMKGDLSVISKLGVGSRFTLNIPAEISAPEAASPQTLDARALPLVA